MKTCLVVDDSKVIRMVAKRIMSEFGFGTEEAEDGEDALQKCLKDMPDVILLDWNMPIMNGLEFLKALRKTPGGTAPKVVFCTTENDLEHITEAIQNGADEYIMKPFDSEIVQSKLEQIGIM